MKANLRMIPIPYFKSFFDFFILKINLSEVKPIFLFMVKIIQKQSVNQLTVNKKPSHKLRRGRCRDLAGTRTRGPYIKSVLLYQLSYQI